MGKIVRNSLINSGGEAIAIDCLSFVPGHSRSYPFLSSGKRSVSAFRTMMQTK
jgi:hypothetical protein